MKILLLTHITMGYGSPEMLNLYKVLEQYGMDVVLSDQEDSIRDYYKIPGINRFFRRNIKLMDDISAKEFYHKMLNFRENFVPDVIISSFLPFIADKKFPLNNERAIKVLYAAELFKEYQDTSIDFLIAPNEERLNILKEKFNNAKSYCIFNVPLKEEINSYKKVNFKNPEVINIFYQGQISELSGVGVLLRAVEITNNAYLHICGDIRDENLLPLIKKLEKHNKLTYHGFLKRFELDDIRSKCHIGYIGWREDLTQDLAIKYCCPTKLYDYISSQQPVIFLKNYTLDRWNDMYNFGFSVGDYNDHIKLANLIDGLLYKKKDFQLIQKCQKSLALSVMNYEYQVRDFIVDLMEIKN